MQLSKTERWILSNQYRVLEALYPKDADHFAEVRQVIEHGYELHYDWVTQFLYDPFPAEASGRVGDILDMFSHLGRAYGELKDKSGIEERMVRFVGFDGNNEVDELDYAQFLIEVQGKWTEHANVGDHLNSHMPTRGRYDRQLAAWEESADKYNLTRDDVARIANAAIHPDHRGT